MLIVNNLIKTFKGQKEPTLKNISFEVEDGEIFGIVGKNGAGKSTTIKSIMGIVPFESGEILVNGYNIKTNPNEAKLTIGYVPDDHSVYENLTGREYVNFMADIYKVDKQKRENKILKYSTLLNMDKALDKQINGYSHGMRQKICIMGALVHTPKLWILDEPFLGLDPQSVKALKKCIKEYSRSKKHLVIFTSHNLDTVVEMCNRVCVIENGQIKDIVNSKTKTGIRKLKSLMR